MNIVFVSNYLNHHQIPFCEAVIRENGGDFTFIQMERMDETRVKMGWGIDVKDYDYAKCYYEEPDECRALMDNCDILIYGGVEDESYVKPRLKAGKIVVRYSERIYKEGQWRFISPRGLKKKYEDHVKYRKNPYYLLCAGAYVASDYRLIHAYPGKMYTWGYFPEFQEYDINELMNRKNSDWGNVGEKKPVKLLYAGRMIDWKHPEYAIEAAEALDRAGVKYELTMVGDGELRSSLENKVRDKSLGGRVTFTGFMQPAEVREKMLDSDIFLFTSDYMEGWGAVLNESMNCGCAVLASSGIGAVPSMLQHGSNGMVYRNGDIREFRRLVSELAMDEKLRIKLGLNAYETIRTKWNAEIAATRFVRFARSLLSGNPESIDDGGPLSKAPVISPKRGYDYTRR